MKTYPSENREDIFGVLPLVPFGFILNPGGQECSGHVFEMASNENQYILNQILKIENISFHLQISSITVLFIIGSFCGQPVSSSAQS